MKRLFCFIFLLLTLTGCSVGPSSPSSVQASSESRSALIERVRFLEQYVSFRRTYLQLEYNVEFRNGGEGLLPSPSEWDIKVLAVVPKDEIYEWISGVSESQEEHIEEHALDWLAEIPGNIPFDGIDEWYLDGRRTIGVDRENSIIAYRNFAI